jgi:hypothetical protein
MKNLADPSFEPTDEQLRELSAKAFANVRAAKEQALRDLRERIAAERKRLLAKLDAESTVMPSVR